ncbi:MAG: hypothetical protein IAG13_06325 [Deltaproteobacteria bacterium]|nr:hypothetical protein [Nannocystaceae bacterium]
MRTSVMLCALGLVLGAAAGVSSGCVACNADVCSDTLWIYFREPGGGALADGEYRIEVARDGEEPEEAVCTLADDGHDLRCTGLDFVLHAPLYDSPDNPHTVLELYYSDDTPAELDVLIVHDGEVLFDERIEPDYELAEPKCDDDCVRSMNKFTLAR